MDYPFWWNSTITVFNKYEDPCTRRIHWYKHILNNCFVKLTGNTVSVGNTTLNTEDVICRIPASDKFKNKFEWDTLPHSKRVRCFTLNPGDIIITGKVDDTIDEYTTGKRSVDLLNKYKNYKGCITITQCVDNTGVGKVHEHYLVRGK